MDESALKRWLEEYGRAWENRDPEAAAGLYAEDGSYQVTPFAEPLRGRTDNSILLWSGLNRAR